MKTDLSESIPTVVQKLGKMLGRHIIIHIENSKTGDVQHDYKYYAGVLDEFTVEKEKANEKVGIKLSINGSWRNRILYSPDSLLKLTIELVEESPLGAHF